MKLNDVYTKPLKDVVEELNLTDMKPATHGMLKTQHRS